VGRAEMGYEFHQSYEVSPSPLPVLTGRNSMMPARAGTSATELHVRCLARIRFRTRVDLDRRTADANKNLAIVAHGWSRRRLSRSGLCLCFTHCLFSPFPISGFQQGKNR